MEKLKFNPNNKKYYSEEFIKGFECGVERQFNADMAEKTAEWIPVSERLPEIHQDVLVSLRSLDVEVGFRAETEPYFYCEGCYIELQNVLAWMPLPEPYKAE